MEIDLQNYLLHILNGSSRAKLIGELPNLARGPNGGPSMKGSTLVDLGSLCDRPVEACFSFGEDTCVRRVVITFTDLSDCNGPDFVSLFKRVAAFVQALDGFKDQALGPYERSDPVVTAGRKICLRWSLMQVPIKLIGTYPAEPLQMELRLGYEVGEDLAHQSSLSSLFVNR